MKISGVRDMENIAQIVALAPRYLCFDFRSSSPSYLGEIDEGLLSIVPSEVTKVGIFDAEDSLYISYVAGRFSLSAIQIEGDLSPRSLELLVAEGLEIIKVINRVGDFARYEGVCNKFLVRSFDVLSGYSSATGLIVDSSLWYRGCGYVVDFGDDFDCGVAFKDVEKIENWRKVNL